MKSGFRYILYLVLALILIGGSFLLLFKDDAFSFLSDNAGLMSPEIALKNVANTSKDSLDDKILNDARFLSLKNNVSKFDFEAICKTAVGTISVVSTSSEGVVSTSTVSVSCALGNGLPFPVPTAKKQ